LEHIISHFKESESHYIREENVLFPYIEKHGITQPPAIMWMEHDKIRETKKSLYKLFDSHGNMAPRDFVEQLGELSTSLSDMLTNHFYKENNILFPTSLNVINDEEWKDIRNQFDDLGYCCFTPQPAKVNTKYGIPISKSGKRLITFETGSLWQEEIEAILNTLPVELTFVDKEDTVRYFNQHEDKIFVRTKAIIGRKVQQCHPKKSIHLVNQILEEFKSGKRDLADFWINFKDKLVYIRYFPVRNKNGEYLGCLEVTQDITNIKKLKGEKRLL